MPFEKIFEKDRVSKRERVERALAFRPVDRAPLHEQLSYNPGVVSRYTRRPVRGFEYTVEEIGLCAKKTLDIVFPLVAPLGTGRITEDGIEFQNDNWTRWIKSRPFCDEDGAKEWLLKKTAGKLKQIKDFDPGRERRLYHKKLMDMQALVGETVLLDISETGFCDVFNKMGLEIFTFFSYEYPAVFHDYMSASTEYECMRVRAGADNSITPVILIAEDFCTKQGPIFNPEFLKAEHYPFVKALAEAWREKGLFVIYHTDGNFKKEIPSLGDCGVQGFYCLEQNCGMSITELVERYPDFFWAGGIDGVDLMENGTPEQVAREVLRVIDETGVLGRGGIFIDTSSEINPTIPPDNYAAMVDAVDLRRNDGLL